MREKRNRIMNIKEVEKITGLTKANIRFYEEEGLVQPKRNEQNNYRIYTEVEIKRLQEVKKLRLLGISIPEIQKIYAEELSLQKAMERRLKEIREEERLLQETRAICQKAIRTNWNLNEIDRLEIKESKEEWQERLRKLMTEDLVQTKLTRNELNNTIGLLFSAGMLISMLTVYFMNVTWIKDHMYIGVAAIGVEVAFLVISAMSSDIKVHMGILFAGAIAQPVALTAVMGFIMELIHDSQKSHTAYMKMEYHYIIELYAVTLLLGILLWLGSKVWEMVLQSLAVTLLVGIIGVGVLTGGFYVSYRGLLGMQGSLIFAAGALMYVVTVLGVWQHANSDWKAYNRYHGVYTAGQMVNVFATIMSAVGYNSWRNWRR
jgi:DNA-binding transcriptional MerR regulator